MADVDFEAAQRACVLASLEERLAKVLKSSKIDIENYWPKIFANAISNCSPESLLKMSCSAPVMASAPAAQVATETAEKPTESPKEEEKQESDDDMGFGGLFD